MPDEVTVTGGDRAIAAMDSLTADQRDYVRGLREMATFLECHPALIGVRVTAHGPMLFTPSSEVSFARLLEQLGGDGPQVVESTSGYVEVRAERRFGPHHLTISASTRAAGAVE